MLSQAINELSWHFIGYMKIFDSIATAEQSFDEAWFAQDAIVITPVEVVYSRGDTAELPYEKFYNLPSLLPEIGAASQARLPYSVETLVNASDFTLPSEGVFFEDGGETDLPQNGDVGQSLDYTYTITFTYRDIYAPDIEINLAQENALTDDDLLLSKSEFGDDIPESNADEVLEQLLDAANEIELDTLDQIFEEEDAQSAADAIGEALVQRAENDAPNPSFTSGDNIGELPEEEQDSDESSDDDENDSSYVTTGDNEAVNVASIVDLSELKCSTVVMGDYYATNSIIQSNLYYGPTEQLTDVVNGQGLSDTVVYNDANVSSEGEYLISSHVTYDNPDYSFTVDVVSGNFYDLNIVSQKNYLSDDDCVSYQLNNNGYYVQTGDNTQVNAAQLIDSIQNYDVIVVLGNYYDVNYISQKNILLDTDYVDTTGTSINGTGRHNVLTNEGTIKNIGGGSLMKPMTSEVHGLVDAMDGRAGEYEYTASSATGGLPILPSTDLKVLYITGDYYQINAIEQINVLSDADYVKIHKETEDSGVLTQTINGEVVEADEDGYLDTSSNKTSNKATIIDYDSQSGFQYLDGEYSEEDIVIKVNIVVSEEEDLETALNGNTDLVSEVVAFTGNDVGSEAGSSPAFVPYAGESDMVSDIIV
ncbi:hypothetical protein SAMN05444141_10275 [Pseudovibrio denitrificans]|uniref:Uncharacterized protein n=1 Tax=Pseudovibrio denitrificans TaxID=258256 RepID=A0A1I6Z4V1_9HYPH|nr:hypothetical protein [Pseudovibrio denitrificans]SFT57753.1 hypothetical protein SAMN05444141_10275 [Pseudovibrio denitrificans]